MDCMEYVVSCRGSSNLPSGSFIVNLVSFICCAVTNPNRCDSTCPCRCIRMNRLSNKTRNTTCNYQAMPELLDTQHDCKKTLKESRSVSQKGYRHPCNRLTKSSSSPQVTHRPCTKNTGTSDVQKNVFLAWRNKRTTRTNGKTIRRQNEYDYVTLQYSTSLLQRRKLLAKVARALSVQ